MREILYLSTGRSDRAMVAPLIASGKQVLPDFTHRLLCTDPPSNAPPRYVVSLVTYTLTEATQKKERPAALVIAGDRYEQVSAGVLAQQYNIPILHLGGGEMATILSTPDTRYRNALTWLASGHCVFTETAKHIVTCLRSLSPSQVVQTGSPALDDLVQLRNTGTVDSLEMSWLANLRKRPFVLVMYHPQPYCAEDVVNKELDAIEDCCSYFRNKYDILITAPNFDSGSSAVKAKLAQICSKLKVSLVEDLHFARRVALRDASLIIGNSSAGRIEASVFGTPVLELGSRQEGRVRPANLTSTDADDPEIVVMLAKRLLAKGPLEPGSPWEHPTGQAAVAVSIALKEMLERCA